MAKNTRRGFYQSTDLGEVLSARTIKCALRNTRCFECALTRSLPLKKGWSGLVINTMMKIQSKRELFLQSTVQSQVIHPATPNICCVQGPAPQMGCIIQFTLYLLCALDHVQLGQNYTEGTQLYTAGGGEEARRSDKNLRRRSNDFARTSFYKGPSTGPVLCRCCVGSQSYSG